MIIKPGMFILVRLADFFMENNHVRKIYILSLAVIAANINLCLSAENLSDYYGFKDIEIIKSEWGISCLSIADLNNDGRNDLIFADNQKAKIGILLQKKELGPEETAVSVDPNDTDINAIEPSTRFTQDSIPVPHNIASLVCADLNSDGLVDIAYYGDPKGLYVVMQKKDEAAKKQDSGKIEKLNWQTKKKFAIDDAVMTPDALVAADINNDGRSDLILAGQKDIYVIYQQQDGTLAEPQKYPSAAGPLSVYVGDINGDKLNDLSIITNDSEKPLHVRFGLAGGQLGPQMKFAIEKPYKLDMANLDSKPGDEISIIDAGGGRLICYKLSKEDIDPDEWPMAFYPLATGVSSDKRDLVVTDVDGDKLEDIVISEPGSAELTMYKQVGGKGFAEPVKFPAFSDIANLAVVENDDKGEIAALSIKEKIIGISKYKDERLSFPQTLKIVGEPVGMTVADVDNDKKPDCVYISRDANDVRGLRIVYDLTKNTEDNQKEPAAVIKKLESNPEGIKVLDVDRDGLADVMIFVKYDQPILLRQTEGGKFAVVDSPNSQAGLIKQASLATLVTADVDAKKGDEILLAQDNFARSLLFEEGKQWKVIDQYNAKSTENSILTVNAFKLDSIGEKPAILLVDGQKGQLQILKRGEDNTYRFFKQLNIGSWNTATHTKMLMVKMGKAKNIVMFDSEKFALITPPDGPESGEKIEQLFSYETKIKDGVYGNIVTGDINSDGRKDFAMVEYKQNNMEILALDSDLKPVPALRFKVFEQKSYGEEGGAKSSVEPREMKIADVTGDGKADLVTLVHDRVIIYPQD